MTKKSLHRNFGGPKIVFFGGDFGMYIFKRLLDDGYQIEGIILNPKRTAKNFSKKVQFFKEYVYKTIQKISGVADQYISQTLILEEAIKHGIRVIQPYSLNQSVVDFIRNLTPDLIVVAGYTKILPEIILRVPKIGNINVHPSLLPQYRGPAPTFWQLLNGEKKSGITVHYLDKEIDTGDIILQRTIDIDDIDTNGTLFLKVMKFGADVIIDALKAIEKDNVSLIKQSSCNASYAPAYSKKDTRIEWSKTAVQINNLIRASNPWPGAYSKLNGIEITVWKAEIIDKHLSMRPGEIVDIGSDYIEIQAGKGIVRVKEDSVKSKSFFKRKSLLSVGAVFE